MAEGRIYFAKAITATTLAGWLEEQFKTGGYRLGLRPDKTELARFEVQQAAGVVGNWPQGRVFNAECEVRWEQCGPNYTVWLLGEKVTPPTKCRAIEGTWKLATGRRPALFLWGKFKPEWSAENSTWIEVRIPQTLHYPISEPVLESSTPDNSEAFYARISYVEYQAPNGAVQFTRLMEVSNGQSR